MAVTSTRAARIRAITSCVPARRFDNLKETTAFDKEEVQKVVRMAGVKSRYMVDETACSSDLCVAAARDVMKALNWAPETIDALIFVTQTPDYFLPSTCCVAHRDLGLGTGCAAFDVGLGCSGYTYGLWLAAMMLQGPGVRRVLLLHGETPTRFCNESDRSVALLFGDSGTATGLESSGDQSEKKWWFCHHTDGAGYADLIIPGGGFRERFPADKSKHLLTMNGSNIMNFTLKCLPALIRDTLEASGVAKEQIDYYIFHQSNRFIMQHLAVKCQLPEKRIPVTLEEFGNTGGPSVPLTIVNGKLARPAERALQLLLLNYGVGLSWGSALVDLPRDAVLNHVQFSSRVEAGGGQTSSSNG